MKKESLYLLLAFILIGVFFPLWAQESQISFTNRFTAMGIVSADDYLTQGEANLAWKPELFGEYHFAQNWRASAELSLYNNLRYQINTEENRLEWDVSLYRAWAALSYKETELKAGLQHIRFGPAQILRPLQWFDNLDPLSLLQDSQGVPAITLTHFFPNPEVKLWLLPGTDKARFNNWGAATKKGTIEFGGRASFQSSLGETGLNYNQRTVQHYYDSSYSITEYQVGLDQRVDGFVGAWLEADASMLSDPLFLGGAEGGTPEPKCSGSTTIGADYTVGIGNGIYLLGEVNYSWSLHYRMPNKYLYDFGDNYRGAIILRYPLGILDSIQLMADTHYYSGFLSNDSIFLSWRRVYDKLSWDISLGLKTNTLRRVRMASFTINYDI